MGYDALGTQDLYVSEIRKLKHALAEKDQELQQIREHEFQNGYREAEAIWEEKYWTLMAMAIRFADGYKGKIEKEHGGTVFQHGQYDTVNQFLQSPEVQAWKEQQK